jgi:hypothetical protein
MVVVMVVEKMVMRGEGGDEVRVCGGGGEQGPFHSTPPFPFPSCPELNFVLICVSNFLSFSHLPASRPNADFVATSHPVRGFCWNLGACDRFPAVKIKRSPPDQSPAFAI